MADISGYIRIINEAEKGEAVRDAITGALEEMNTYGGNASTLENHPASYFATATFFTAVAEQVGEVDDVLIAIENGLNALKYDMGEHTLEGSGGSFTVDCTGIKGYDNLDVSKFYFEILGGSNASQAGNWTPSQSYNPETGIFTYSWGALSNNIRVRLWIVKPTHTSVGIQVQPLVITENGNWDAGANAAYNPVTIRVPNVIDVRKLTQSITKNGVFTFTPEPNTGFNEVVMHVNVPTPPEKVLVTQTFTENGTYRAVDEEPAADGFSIVTVNVDPKILIEEKTLTTNGDWSAADEGADGVMTVHVDVPNVDADLGHKVIGQNGIYNAEDDELDGYDSVTVAVPTKELHEVIITENGTYEPSQEIPAFDGYSKVKVMVTGGGTYPVNSANALFGYNRFDYEYFPAVLGMFDTSEIADFSYAFRDCTTNDGDLDLTGLDVSSAATMMNMFSNFKCDTLTFDEHIFDGPMSASAPVTDMFTSATIGKIIFGACKFPKNCYRMFNSSGIGEIEMSGCDLSDVGNHNSADATNGMFMFVRGDFIEMVDECVGQIFHTIKQALFYRAAFSNLSGQLTGGKTFGKVVSAAYMFQDYRGNIDNLDPTLFDYSECLSMYYMFQGISNASGSSKTLYASGIVADLCTDIRSMFRESSFIRTIIADNMSFAIAINAENYLYYQNGCRVISITNLNIPSVTSITYFLQNNDRLRFVDVNGITVGSITNARYFMDSCCGYLYKIGKTFTAEVGVNTAVITLSSSERDYIMYEGIDDDYNFMHYYCVEEDLVVTNVVFSYENSNLTITYENTSASSFTGTLIIEPRCHVYLPKTFDCSVVSSRDYKPLWDYPERSAIDIYTDATQAEAEALGWSPKVCDALGFNFHFEVSHSEFLALPEVVYQPTMKRYGYFLITQEAFEYDPTYTVSADGKTLTVSFDVDADVRSGYIGMTFRITSGTTVKFESTTNGYKQCGTCGQSGTMPQIVASGRDRGYWTQVNNGSAMNYTATKNNSYPVFFIGGGHTAATTIEYTLTITD